MTKLAKAHPSREEIEARNERWADDSIQFPANS